jgi:hypothetical protein
MLVAAFDAIDQDPADEVERLLRAGRHEHVLRTNAETVMRSPIRDRLPKRGYAISRAVLQRARSMSPQDSLAGVAEFIDREQLFCGHAPGERDDARLEADFLELADG